MIVTLAAEGVVDIAAATRLCEHAGHSVHRTFPTQGKVTLNRQLSGYNNAARLGPWLVLRDLDHDAECAPALVETLLPARSPLMLLRVAVHSLEAWLLADAGSFAAFFQIHESAVPNEPDLLPNPKRIVLDLVQRSEARSIRDAMLPPQKSMSRVGPGYSAKLIEFIREHWRIEAAVEHSPSLRKCVGALAALDRG